VDVRAFRDKDIMKNVDSTVVTGFGREWSHFTQTSSDLSPHERKELFQQYFRIFPWQELPPDAVGLDAGCGTGRWAIETVERTGCLHVLDASADALEVARQNLAGRNVIFHLASVSDIPLKDASLDFAYSLGVLHHVPDTAGALRHIASKLKPRAPFLVYLYYALDNRPIWYRTVWKIADAARLTLSRWPDQAKLRASFVIAAAVYWPIARFCACLAAVGVPTHSIPLEAYKDRGFYTMRTDAYDRFCTALEKRFTKKKIEEMLRASGFDQIEFSESVPFWCAIARRSIGSGASGRI
jgi:SAM-dependent methyltransferase